MQMKRIYVTHEFVHGAKKLVNSNNALAINNMRTALIDLVNGFQLPSKFRDHQLSNSKFRELHIDKDILLLYRHESDDQLVISLKLSNITNHKKLSHDATAKNQTYHEVSTQELHEITSTTHLESQMLVDIIESIADYTNMSLDEYFILSESHYIRNNKLHIYYNCYSDETEEIIDMIDFIIDLDRYPIHYMPNYINQFSKLLASEIMTEVHLWNEWLGLHLATSLLT